MNNDTLTIDGAQGEGGGQIVRSALSLALVTGRPIVLKNIRAGRKKSGLLKQHLAAVKAATLVSSASVRGDQLGSSSITFEPQEVRSGSYEVRIGTAGSTTLVLQTILPALMLAESSSTVTLTGGTHNTAAPPVDFLETTFLPLLARMGPRIAIELDRYGFYPAGGGQVRANITPSDVLAPLRITDGGEPTRCSARAIVAQLPRHIGEREVKTVIRKLGWCSEQCNVEEVTNSGGPGNVLLITIERGGVAELFTGFGERGVQAEKVAATAARAAQNYLKTDVPVGEHLADQLLLPMAIAAHFCSATSEFRTVALSEHSRSHILVLEQFLSVRIETRVEGRDDVFVRVVPD